ncbi:hypothetical protein [Bandra megavirus]|uniref:Uncharacterized protein n=1 Tax=Bandra megavirus TaxID=2071566 RepID=A0A2K9V8I5_9VIRU|nr:hypothetical protein [Bandra megavirus]
MSDDNKCDTNNQSDTNNQPNKEYYMDDDDDNNMSSDVISDVGYDSERGNNYLEKISDGVGNIQDFINANMSIYEEKSQEDLSSIKNSITSFLSWIKLNTDNDNTYKNFSNVFSSDYRISLYENVIKYFDDESIITDEFLTYWKFLVTDLMKNSRKYKSYTKDITINFEEYDCNLRLVKQKYIFKCYIDEESICYFKENGNDYYVS